MKHRPGAAFFRGAETRSLIAAFTAAVCWLWLAAGARALPAVQAAGDDLFQGDAIPRISIRIDPEGMEKLRQAQSGQRNSNKPRATARVGEGGKAYAGVTVQLKGFSSFSTVDETPSFTLHFEKEAAGGLFHGLSKISLNNSAQDSTFVHEKFSREVFAAAGVPVPRADYAIVSLNGRDLGLYVLVEGYDKKFLKRHFKNAEGNLYDGGVLRDIDHTPQLTSGAEPANHKGIERLLRASREADPGRRYQALAKVLDLERFYSMVAIETMLCHSDSYSMNRNNYRLYHDPATDKMVFMPHGMDRVLGEHRSDTDLTIVPPMLGLVARAALTTPEGRKQYLERAGYLFTNVFQPARLCQQLRDSTAKMAAFRPGHERDVQHLCEKIRRRTADLEMQFSHWDEIITPVPTPRFDEDGVAPVTGWRVKHKLGRRDATLEAVELEGRPMWRLTPPAGASGVSLSCPLSLPAGRYQLTGRLKATGPDGTALTGSSSVVLMRYSSDRFGADPMTLSTRELNHSFWVSPGRAPEEMELILNLRAPEAEVWVDTSSLRLVRQAR